MNTEKTISLANEKFHINPYNAQHIGKRDEQQDYFAFSDIFNNFECERIGALAVLSDGMGGLNNGYAAAKTTVSVFLEKYGDVHNPFSDTCKKMLFAARRANDAVKKIGDAGATLCAATVKDDMLHWLSVGDSRIYLYRNGGLKQLNREHNYKSVLEDMVRKNQISPKEAATNPDREALTSYIGTDELTETDFGTLQVYKGDSVFLCSDGLYRALTNDEIAYVLCNAADNVCEVLIKRALSKNISTQDNITAVLMDID